MWHLEAFTSIMAHQVCTLKGLDNVITNHLGFMYQAFENDVAVFRLVTV